MNALGLPDILLNYQKNLLRAVSTYPVVICEKSRRIGVTWAMAADAVLTASANKAASGMDVFYIGFNLDMAREFIDTSAQWAKSLSAITVDIEETLFKDDHKDGDSRDIQAFRIKFDSGFAVTALTSRPRSLRGRQGFVIIDEAAFHDDLPELMKAALAMLIWGGKVLVISTHDGVNNPFNALIGDARSGRNHYHVLRIDFDDALQDGLYRRICLTTGQQWSQASESMWRQGIIDFYGDGADEELFCVPRLSSGAFLPSLLIESRMAADIPVLRLNLGDDFAQLPEPDRHYEIEQWCTVHLTPLLENPPKDCSSSFGADIARNGDLSVFWPLVIEKNLVRRTPFVVELRNVPFRQQLQVVWSIIDGLPRFLGGAMDARGNGQQMAEETAGRYGSGRIHQVMTSTKWYLDALPKYKAALEDGLMILPRDGDILNDHRAAVMQGGIPQIPDKRIKGSDGGKRHGDALIAAAMAYWASLHDVICYGYDPVIGGKELSAAHGHNAPGRFERKGTW